MLVDVYMFWRSIWNDALIFAMAFMFFMFLLDATKHNRSDRTKRVIYFFHRLSIILFCIVWGTLIIFLIRLCFLFFYHSSVAYRLGAIIGLLMFIGVCFALNAGEEDKSN